MNFMDETSGNESLEFQATRKAKSAAERSRIYRASKKRSGGMELSIFLGPKSSLALSIIKAHCQCTQTQALENALIQHALLLMPSQESFLVEDMAPSSAALNDETKKKVIHEEILSVVL